MEKSFIGAVQPLTAETLCEKLPQWQIENGKADFMDYLYELYDRANEEPGLKGITRDFGNDSKMTQRRLCALVTLKPVLFNAKNHWPLQPGAAVGQIDRC